MAADGRTLTIRFTGAAAGSGPCQAEYLGGADETAHAVGLAVLPITRPADEDEPSNCTAEGHRRVVTVRLGDVSPASSEPKSRGT